MVSDANQYIAQQVFNLSAAQFPAAEFEKDTIDASKIQKKNYQAVRLDPNDLKTGLIGPYAVCFSAASADSVGVGDSSAIDGLFARAIGMPRHYGTRGREGSTFIESISVCPEKREIYERTTEQFAKIGSKEGESLTRENFRQLAEIPFFAKCPRIIYSLTAPQRGDIPNSFKETVESALHVAFSQSYSNSKRNKLGHDGPLFVVHFR